MKILIAGASGFIGRALITELLKDPSHEIVALSRRARKTDDPRVEWRKADLFSMRDVAEGMSGCDRAYYLVHSMLPSAALDQGSFYDFDLILADNFARVARAQGLKHLVYLGGMIPDEGELSWHLKSRLEVEEALRESGVPLTVLRAGLIIGEGGSSFDMLRKLVERLPWMVCPAWTRTESQPVALSEVIEVLLACLKEERFKNRIYDVGGPEVMSYQELLGRTALALGVKRRFFSFNLIPLALSRLWVSLITGAPRDLVYPLVLSLRHPMVADPGREWKDWVSKRVGISSALESALSSGQAGADGRASGTDRSRIVRSVQRLHHPRGFNAADVAQEYFLWLPRFLFFLVRVEVEGKRCSFHLLTRRILLLRLEKSEERSTPDRQLLYVRGGLLASSRMARGRLEFREALHRRVILAALHDFIPALPWGIYRYTQALIHLWVMKSFDSYLRKYFFK